MATTTSASPPASHREDVEHRRPHKYPDYGGNPLAHMLSNESESSARLPAFAGGLQPGLYKPPPFKFGNPVPLGLSGFALTTFLLSMINLNTRNLQGQSSMVAAPAYAYGGFVQLLAGMWEIALGNVFGGTALSTYGGFQIEPAYGVPDFYTAFAFYIFAWMIITIIFWLCTLRSTLSFTCLFGSVWLAFIFLGCSYLDAANNDGVPDVTLTYLGGGFGIAASFIAWYEMVAGIADSSNSFAPIPILHFPWSEKGRADKKNKKDASDSV